MVAQNAANHPDFTQEHGQNAAKITKGLASASANPL